MQKNEILNQTSKNIIIIKHKNIDYNIDRQKLVRVLEILLDRENISPTDEEINSLLTQYDLYDDVFLSQINELWFFYLQNYSHVE